MERPWLVWLGPNGDSKLELPFESRELLFKPLHLRFDLLPLGLKILGPAFTIATQQIVKGVPVDA